jgi:hypothetical protein
MIYSNPPMTLGNLGITVGWFLYQVDEHEAQLSGAGAGSLHVTATAYLLMFPHLVQRTSGLETQ